MENLGNLDNSFETQKKHDKFLEFIKSDNFMAKFIDKKEKKDLVKTKFFNSPLCERMVQDIIAKDYSLSNEHFAYFPQDVKTSLGWSDISDDDINLFISVMSEDKLFPVDVPTQADEDYLEIYIVRRGLSISVLHGQGCAIIIKKAK